MIGIVIASHGMLAEGAIDSCKLFFPEGLQQVKTAILRQKDSVIEFQNLLENLIHDVDSGAGVIVFCDLPGGSPSNCCGRLLQKYAGEDIQFITGFNFAILLELLGQRLTCDNIKDIDIQNLIETGRENITSLNQQFRKLNDVSKIEDTFYG